MWELEAIAKANHREEGRKRPSEEEMEGLKKRVRKMIEKDAIQKEDVVSLIEAISTTCCLVCFSRLLWQLPFHLLRNGNGVGSE